jgi:hypothetical protein
MTQPTGAWQLDRNSGLLIPVVQTGIGIVDPRGLPLGDGAAFLELRDGDRAAESPTNAVRLRSTSAGKLQASENGAAWVDVISGGPAASVFEYFPVVNTTANQGSYRTQNVAGTGSARSNLFGPMDMVTLLAVELIGFNVSATPGPGADIDLTSEYGNIQLGEASNNHTQTDTTSTYTIPAVNDYFRFDVTGVFSLLTAGDGGGLFIDHNSTLAYTTLRVRYGT